MRLGIERMVWIGGAASLAGGLAMVALARAGQRTRLWAPFAIVAPMVCYMIGTGIVIPNAQAGGLGPFPRMAGAASALMGFLQMAIAASFGIAFGQLHDGTAAADGRPDRGRRVLQPGQLRRARPQPRATP